MRPVILLALFALAATAPAAAVDKDAPKDVPAPSTAPVPKGAYVIDKAHTSLLFRVSHLGFSTYTGRFTRVDAELQFNPANIAASRVNVNIDPRSIEADNAPSGFLQALAGNQWLDADRFPGLTFRSQSVEADRREQLPYPWTTHAAWRDQAPCARGEIQRRLRRAPLRSAGTCGLFRAGHPQALGFRCELWASRSGQQLRRRR